MKKILLKIKNLTKKYKNFFVFQNLNLNIYKNDILALLGFNGAGKTTLIEIICDIKKYDKGKILYSKSKNTFLHNLQVCFQEGSYPSGIKVRDVVLLFSNIYYVLKDKYLYEKLKIKELENKIINSLSFGQRKRVELYIALFSKSEFIILDEITSGVDVWMRIIFLDILKKYVLKNNLTIIYVTHNFEEISKICTRAVLLSKKGIVLDKKINEKINIQNLVENKIIEIKKEDEKQKKTN